MLFAIGSDDGVKLGVLALNLKGTIIRGLKGMADYVSSYKNISALGQVGADVGLALGVALGLLGLNLL